MKEFANLEIDFNSNTLFKELNSIISDGDWLMHFNTSYFDGEWKGINLISSSINRASLAPDKTNDVSHSNYDWGLIPYTKALLEKFKCRIISARYLKLKPGSIIKTHVDPDIGYWNNLVRIHLPIYTNASTWFTINDVKLQMSINKTWYADFSKPHSVINEGATERIHMILDLEVNTWVRDLFIQRGIIQKDQKKPEPIDLMSLKEKLSMIESLKLMNTEVSLNMAKELELKLSHT